MEAHATDAECSTVATPASRRTLALFGTLGILGFATYSNGADFFLLFVPPSTMLLGVALLQLVVPCLLAVVISLGDSLPVRPRVVVATALLLAVVTGTLALPAVAASLLAAVVLLCACCVTMGAGSGVLQATTAGLAGGGGPAFLRSILRRHGRASSKDS